MELSGSTYRFNKQEFSMVGGYTENLEKPQNGQNWGEGGGVGACSGQYGINPLDTENVHVYTCIIQLTHSCNPPTDDCHSSGL